MTPEERKYSIETYKKHILNYSNNVIKALRRDDFVDAQEWLTAIKAVQKRIKSHEDALK